MTTGVRVAGAVPVVPVVRREVARLRRGRPDPLRAASVFGSCSAPLAGRAAVGRPDRWQLSPGRHRPGIQLVAMEVSSITKLVCSEESSVP
ncbi:hypothetical protein, partial [Kitasatospora indigofera]|uniref:hypothetical protein n=1 Tax=Kitasatospora indigofera TaxID=67307 RepID=UPI0033A8E4AB